MGLLMMKGRMVFIGGPKQMKRGLGKVIKESMAEGAGLWHRRYLPMHFKQGAGRRYRYQPRTRPYLRHKRKKHGHSRPLEFSGELRREVTRRATITGTSRRARVTMDTGQAWYATRKWKNRATMPDMEAEITKTTNREVKKIAHVIEAVVERRLNGMTDRETTV
jgi:hypothetical protein